MRQRSKWWAVAAATASAPLPTMVTAASGTTRCSTLLITRWLIRLSSATRMRGGRGAAAGVTGWLPPPAAAGSAGRGAPALAGAAAESRGHPAASMTAAWCRRAEASAAAAASRASRLLRAEEAVLLREGMAGSWGRQQPSAAASTPPCRAPASRCRLCRLAGRPSPHGRRSPPSPVVGAEERTAATAAQPSPSSSPAACGEAASAAVAAAVAAAIICQRRRSSTELSRDMRRFMLVDRRLRERRSGSRESIWGSVCSGACCLDRAKAAALNSAPTSRACRTGLLRGEAGGKGGGGMF
jgi:hypothetical protein